MTHTYSRGCFKLIFRKCLPIYTTPTLRAASTRRGIHIRTFFIAIARLLALSRRRTSTAPALSPLLTVSRTRMPFLSYLPSFFLLSIFSGLLLFDSFLFVSFSSSRLIFLPFSSSSFPYINSFFLFFISYSLLPCFFFP